MPMNQIETYVKEYNIDIAILAIPKAEAVQVAEKLVIFGIRAIWNFAHIDLNVPQDVVVENVHLSESLMRLSYNLANRDLLK